MIPPKFHILFQQGPSTYIAEIQRYLKLSCPSFSQQYIGKTDRSLGFRLHDQATRPGKPIYHHLANCNGFIELVSFYGLPDFLNDHPTPCISFKNHILNVVYNNFEIIDFDYNKLSR